MKSNILILLLITAGCSLRNIPKNLDECYASLDKKLSRTTIEEFKTLPETKAMNSTHLELGMWIRNNWGLWSSSELSKYFNKLGLNHPDDISTVILRSYHRKLNNKEIRLDEQIDYYKQYWKPIIECDKRQRIKAVETYNKFNVGDTINVKMPLGKNNSVVDYLCTNSCLLYTSPSPRDRG